MANSKCDHGVLNDNEQYLLQQLIDKVANPLTYFLCDEIKKVTLTDIHIHFHTPNNSLIIIQGNNALDTLHEINIQPAKEKIRLAKFNILMADGQEHTLTIEPDNIFYDGGLDIIHQWLVKRGFVINKSLAAKKTFPLIPSGIFLSVATTVPP